MDCAELVYFDRRTKTWRDDDGRPHYHPPLPADWRWFGALARAFTQREPC